MTIDALRELGVREGSRVGLEMDNWYFKASTYKGLVHALPGVEFVDVTEAVLGLRTIKSPAEIGHMRQAARFCDIGFQALADTLQPGDFKNSFCKVETDCSNRHSWIQIRLRRPAYIATLPRDGPNHQVGRIALLLCGEKLTAMYDA